MSKIRKEILLWVRVMLLQGEARRTLIYKPYMRMIPLLASVLMLTILLPAQAMPPVAEPLPFPIETMITEYVVVELAGTPAAAGLDERRLEPLFDNWYKLFLQSGESVAGMQMALETRVGVLGVYPDFIVTVPEPILAYPGGPGFQSRSKPNDPRYPKQWHMQDIQAEAAWDVTQGQGVVVAVVDTGVASGGPDGFCRKLHSEFNALTDQSGEGKAYDDHYHGTHVAGTIAQCTGNNIGVSGLAYQAQIMAVKVLDSTGEGPFADIAQGISWAVDNGADVINLSLGMDCVSAWPTCSVPVANAALDKAAAADVIVVAAAGNDSTDNVNFPANYPSVMGIMATETLRQKASYSTYGQALSMAAPGGDNNVDLNNDGEKDGILQETIVPNSGWGYYLIDGTSSASPHVAGAAALLRACVPEASRSNVQNALEQSAVDLGDSGFDKVFGHGYLQIDNALDTLAMAFHRDAHNDCAVEETITAGDYHVCKLGSDGKASCEYLCKLDSEGNSTCKGWDNYGQVSGDGGVDQASERPLKTGGRGVYTEISAGRYHTCALTKEGKAECWGRDKDGQSTGNFVDDADENSDGKVDHTTGGDGMYTDISAGGFHTCAIKKGTGNVDCWGANIHKQAEDQNDGPYIQVSAGWDFTCALKTDGSVHCWGNDKHGQVNGTMDDTNHEPRETGPYTQVSAGQAHTCATKKDGTIDCWGFKWWWWRTANNQAENQQGPYLRIDAGGAHTCAWKLDGTVDCWGKKSEKQIDVPQDLKAKTVTAGREFSCGLNTGGTTVCWGNVATEVNLLKVFKGGPSAKAASTGGPSAKFMFTMTDQSDVYREEFYLADGDSKSFGAPLPIDETFTITQDTVDGYDLSIACDGPVVVDGHSVTGTPVLNETVTCTFTNTYVGPKKEDVPKAEGESLAYTTSNTESNQNSSFDQADVLSITPQGAGAAIQGAISPAGDVDFFKLEINNPGTLEPGGGILFDVDADSGGSDLDAELCVYDGNRNLIGCNDDADGLDPMLYVPNCGEADLYYVEVRGYSGASTGDYVLSIDAELVIVSPERGGRVDNLRFDAEDILARTSITGPVQYKWIKFFDASDLGIYKNIIAFDLLNSCPGYGADLAVTFTGKQRITDSTGRTWKSTPYDVVSIDVSQFGPASSGEFDSQLILKGSAVGLTSRGERIDAITYMNGALLVSMAGGANLPDGSGGTIQAQDEDLAYLVNGAPQPAWALWFDGSTVPGLAKEDLYAASFDSYFGDPDEVLYYLIQGKGRVNGYPASQRTLCVYEGPGYAYCQGSQVAPFNIDALD